MSPSKVVLEDDQKFTLMKFRRGVADILQPQHDDRFLLRWLRARSWDSQAAEKMLRQSMKWRQQWEVDGALKTWEPPEPVVKYYLSGVSGYDKDGAPVIIVPFAGLDVVGFLHSCPRQDLIKATIQTLEKYLDMAAQTEAFQVVVIFDMDGFNLRQYAWRPAAEVVISLIQMYEANYPEILKACYIINAPRVFAIAFNVVKKFFNEYTLGKIQIYKSDPKKWQAVIARHIDPDNLPKYFGGNLVDPDGNPRYITKIKQGGKIPKSYYTNKFDQINNEQAHTSTVVKKGDKLVMDFIVADQGCFLRWDFRTEGHDIRFGITLKDADGNTSSVMRHRRVASNQINESGVLACQAPATYIVTFDNSYSLMRSKKLHYQVYVTLPLSELEILPTEEEIDINNIDGSKIVASTSQDPE